MNKEEYRQTRCRALLANTIIDPITNCMTRPNHNGDYQVISILGTLTRAHRYIAFSMLLRDDEQREANQDKVVCHTCDNKACINPNHLYIGTMVDNVADAIDRGGYAVGEDSWSAKITQEDVDKIRLLAGLVPQGAIGRVFGISQQQVSRIISGKKWARS